MVKSSSKRLNKGRLDEIIRKVKRINNLHESVVIHESKICKRLNRGTTFSNAIGGHTSTLLDLEPTFVSIIVHMAWIRQSLTPAQALNLINGMINMATVQKKLIAFKEKYSTADTYPGGVGPGYWRGFRKRNDHMLVIKKFQNTSLTAHNGLLT